MYIRQAVYFAWIPMLIILFQEISSQAEDSDQSKINYQLQNQALESIASTNRSERMRSVFKLEEQRRQLVQRLMSILDSTNSDMVKVDAVIVLGEYRASEAVAIMVQHLEWDNIWGGASYNASISDEKSEEKNYPVMRALIKIGLPAVPALLKRIEETDDASMTARCVDIWQAIEGEKLTHLHLNEQMESEIDQQKKNRIQSALNTLKMFEKSESK